VAAFDLDRLHRDLLIRLGRRNEAVEAACAGFQAHPSKFSYDELIELVPEGERQEWHDKALNAAGCADLRSLIDLFVHTEDVERLARVWCAGPPMRLWRRSVTTAPSLPAKKLETPHPRLAARLWRAQGMRILAAKKSQYYGAALSNFEHARDCYRQAGLDGEWEDVVRRVRASHSRKTGFIGGFERLVTSAKLSSRPSFLDSAKARWTERQGLEEL
jgi:hypothetical protein